VIRSPKLLLPLSLLFPVAATCLYFMTEVDSAQIYSEGQRILASEGPDAAADYFSDQAIQTGDPLALFGAAWVAYIDGQASRAEQSALFLANESEDPIVRAHCAYLLGHIATDRGDFAQATIHFHSALSGYRRHGSAHQVYNAILGLAKTEIMTGRLAEGQRYLDKAEELADRDGFDKSFVFAMQIQISDIRSDYETAFDLSRALVAYLSEVERHDSRQFIPALNNLSFYSLLTGRIEEGAQHLTRVSVLFTETDIGVEKQFFNVCTILFLRCTGKSYEATEAEVLTWLSTNHHLKLQNTLDFVLAWNCQS